MSNRRIVLFVVLGIAYSIYARPIVYGAGSGTSAKRLGSLRVEEFGAYNALGEISQKAGVVIGVDAVLPKAESTITLDFPGGTVANLLDMFVAAAPGYGWSAAADGVIHVSRDGGHVSLLDVVLSYPGAVKKTRRDIWEDIGKRPEILGWLQANRCSRGELFNGKEFRDYNEPISIDAGSLTVEQLLDDVATKSGVNYWAVLQSPANTTCTVHIILW